MTALTHNQPPTCFARSAIYRAKAAADAGDWLTAGREFHDCIRQFLVAMCDVYPIAPHDGSLAGMLQALVDCPDCCTTAEQHMRDAIAVAAKMAAGETFASDDALVGMFYVNDMLVESECDGELLLPASGKPVGWTWDHVDGDRR